MDQDSITIISDHKESKIKIILIGDQCVGKSKLMEQMLNIESKVNDKQIQSVDFFISRILLPDKRYQKIHVWITSGEIKNISMIRAFLLQCHIYIIAFSLNDPISLENALNTWFSCCVKNAKQTNAYYYFLGTKADLERKCGNYDEIITKISNKCDEYRVAQSASKQSSYEIKGIRQSDRWNSDQLIEFSKKALPANVYYSESSASEGNGLERSISIFTKLVQSALSIAEEFPTSTVSSPAKQKGKGQPPTSMEVQKAEYREGLAKEEAKQSTNLCCNMF